MGVQNNEGLLWLRKHVWSSGSLVGSKSHKSSHTSREKREEHETSKGLEYKKMHYVTFSPVKEQEQELFK